MDKQIEKLKGKHIVIMAGGTGGHIFPALSVAGALSEKGAIISWLGTKYGLEGKLVSAQYPIDYISARGLRNRGFVNHLLSPFQILLSVIQALYVLKKRRTKLVIGFGGYPAGAGGLASKIVGLPLIIHEQNAVPGVTNRLLSKFANKVLCAFPSSRFKNKKNLEVIGNPIRPEIHNIHAKVHDFYKHSLNVLVLGGSQGAKLLNEQLPLVLKSLPKGTCPYIWHQTGEKDHKKTIENYHNEGLIKDANIKVDAFIENIAEAYQWADIVVSRSGASTVSELAAAGLPAFFIPFPHATDDHQYHNAQFLVQAEAAICIRQQYFSPEKLAAFIRAMDLNRAALVKMSMHAKGVAKLDAIEKLLRSVAELIK